MGASWIRPAIKGGGRLVFGAMTALLIYSAAKTQPLPEVPPIPPARDEARSVDRSLPAHAPTMLPAIPPIPPVGPEPAIFSAVPPVPLADVPPAPLPPIPPAPMPPVPTEPTILNAPRPLAPASPAPQLLHDPKPLPTGSAASQPEIILPAPRFPVFQPATPDRNSVPRAESPLAPPAATPSSPPSLYDPFSGAPPASPMKWPEMEPAGPSSTGYSTAAPATDDKPVFDISWQNGVFFTSRDRNFSLHAGGAVQYDAAWYQATPILQLAPGGTGPFHDGVNLRRARLFMEGTFYHTVDYKFELEFANGFLPAGPGTGLGTGNVTNSPGPTDAWITVKEVPLVGNVRIGSQKEWFSLEHLSNYKYLEFMERSYLFDSSQPTAFNNGFTPGVSLFRTWANDRLFSAVGMYKNESDLLGFGLGDGQYAWTGRLAALPLWRPDDRMYWHVGGAMSQRDPVDGAVQIRVRDNIRNAPFPLLNLIANTGLIPTGSQDLYNLETAAVWGPLTLQAEYTANVLNDTAVGGVPAGNVLFQGYYAQALWLLTGESRTWNTKNFFFNRVIPKNPLRLRRGDSCAQRGFGAWEIGVRYSYLDLSNSFVQAGRLDSVTVGLNWYLNANAKLQFNYDMTHRGDTDNAAQGTIHAFGTRCAFDF
jgi:phosphate-selective porin OprO/OprP